MDNFSENFQATFSQGLKLGLEYLNHPLVQDIKKTGGMSISAEGIVVEGIKRSFFL